MNNELKFELEEKSLIDYYFHYNFVSRFIILNKFFKNNKKIINSFNLLKVKIINLYFIIKKLEDIDSLCTSNYFYFSKYFLGKRMFISKYFSIFNRGITHYNFKISLFLQKKDIFFFFYFFSSEVYCYVNKDFIVLNNIKKNISIIFKDIVYFTEKKNNVGFFNLKHDLHIKITCLGSSSRILKRIFLTFYKI